MVPWPCVSGSVAPTAPERFSVKISSPSTLPSPSTGTLTVWGPVLSAGKVSVPAAGV
jgi:hypothetical protein